LHLFDHSERSERRELCNGATSPSTAVQSQRSEDRLTEAPGGCPASALLAWIVEYLFADIEIKQGASTDPLDSGIAWRVEHGALEQLT
jgi:hypothetical protein